MNRITREAKTGCRQIRVTSGTGATGARLYRSAFRGIEPVVPRRRRPAPGGPRLRGSGQDTGRPGAIRGRNLADGGSPWRKVAEPGGPPEPRHTWSGPISADGRTARPRQDSNLRTRPRGPLPLTQRSRGPEQATAQAGASLGYLTQHPADRLADEELLLAEHRVGVTSPVLAVLGGADPVPAAGPDRIRSQTHNTGGGGQCGRRSLS